MGRSRAATFWLPALTLVLLLVIGVLTGFFAIFYRVSEHIYLKRARLREQPIGNLMVVV